MKTQTNYFLYDGRYTSDPNRAICYEVCETLKEAKESANDYGDDTVIVKTKSESIDGKSWQVLNQELVTTTPPEKQSNKR